MILRVDDENVLLLLEDPDAGNFARCLQLDAPDYPRDSCFVAYLWLLKRVDLGSRKIAG